jgi:exonuclease SbcC
MTPTVENAAEAAIDRPTVRCRAVRVGQALGIRHGAGFSVTGLSPGITLVLAPNGTGKTTMARALALLALGGGREAWRQLVGTGAEADASYRRLDVSAAFEVVAGAGGALPVERTVSVLGGEVQEHQGGHEYRSPSPDLAIAARYFISLPDLLVDEGGGFGQQILEQASGGIRWALLRQSLGWSETPGRPRVLINQRKAARSAHRSAESAHSELGKRADALPALRRDRDTLRQRVRRATALDRAQDGRQLRGQLAALQQRIDGFDSRLHAFVGTERASLQQLELPLNQATDQIEECLKELERMELAAPAPLTEQERRARVDVIEGLVATLEARQQALSDAQKEYEEAGSQLHEAASQLSALDAGSPPVEADSVPVDAILSAGKSVSRAAWDSGAKSVVHREMKRHADALQERWGRGQDAATASADDVRDAIRLLSHWLRQPRVVGAPVSEAVSLPVLSALILGGLSLVASLVGAIAGSVPAMAGVAFGLAALVLLLFWFLRRRSTPTPAPAADSGREEYERLARVARGIPLPDEWAVEPVSELHARLAKRAVLIERDLLLNEMRATLRGLESSSATAEQALEEATAALGELVKPSNVGSDAVWASTIAALCTDWLQAKQRVTSAQALVTSAASEVQTAAALARDALVEAGCLQPGTTEVLSAELARECFNGLKVRIDRRDNYERNQHAPARDRERRLKTRRADAERELQVFLDGIPGGPFTRASLDSLLEHWDRYAEDKAQLSTCRVSLRDHVERFPEPEGIQRMSDAEIAAEIAEIPELERRESELIEEIVQLEQQVRDAGAGKAVSAALDALTGANLELRNREIADLDIVIGQAVLGWARREAQTAMAPRVLRRACQLAAEFTSGRLQFEVDALDQHEGAVFRARNAAEPWRPIAQLSSGERVQLLLSVRLAFLEEGESMRLPIILDEVLASSDDDRAGRVMDSVIDVAKSGRQVIYLSSQADEIEKWSAKIQGGGVDFRVIRLAEVRGIDAADGRPARRSLPPERLLPAPDGCTREQYAEILGVPAIDWRDDQLDSMHLWYVLPDVSELHRQISTGVESLGQLERLASQAGSGTARIAFEQSRPRAMGFRAAASDWRVGRGARVGPEVLQECDAISDAFRQRVSECLRQSHGDAREFLEQVRNLRGFREASAVRLEQWLHANGHLVEAARRSPDDIRNAVLVALHAAGTPEDKVGEIVNEVMGQLPP